MVKKSSTNFSKDAGVTTIIVVCVMAVIMALSLSLLLTASVLMKTSARTLAGEQCKILAVSFSDEIRNELTNQAHNYSSKAQEEAGRGKGASQESMWHYIRQNMEDGVWPPMEEGKTVLENSPDRIRSFEMSNQGIAGEISDITLSLYWTANESNERPDKLTVETLVTVKGRSCRITDVYQLYSSRIGYYDKWTWEHIERK